MDKQYETVDQETMSEFVGEMCNIADKEEHQVSESLGTNIITLIKLNKIQKSLQNTKSRLMKILSIRMEKIIYFDSSEEKSIDELSLQTSLDVCNYSHGKFVEMLGKLFDDLLSFLKRVKRIKLVVDQIGII